MRTLIINKFLFPNGGSETYIFKLGEQLEKMGHEVQYFGMEHEGRCVGNRVNAYTSDMDFHGGSKLSKLTYPIKTIYSKEARVQLRKVLDNFQPDVCHLNNFNYQLTPSMILEIVKWRKETGKNCKIVFTAHDYQLVCPNHMLNNPNTHQNCEECLGGHFMNCMKGKCIHGSTAKSAIGMMEAEFWKWKGTYKYLSNTIAALKMIILSDASKNVKKQEVKEIVDDEHLQTVLRCTNYDNEKLTRKILLDLMKSKQYGLYTKDFEYPQIDENKCVRCYQCIKVCPIKAARAQ